jgi:uncharacterized cupin superfamily protein
MHVSPHEFRAVRTGSIVLRFAELGPVAFVLADIPSGSTGTALEEPCERPHWGFVLDGNLELERGAVRASLDAGTAFHIPAGGPPHRLFASGPARAAGFEILAPDVRIDDDGLRSAGFELVSAPNTIDVPSVDAPAPARGKIDCRVTQMGSLAMSQARFGPVSGYTSNWCDLPHWGIVLDGRVAIEWEDSVEVLSSGDVYACPQGPPGHRIQAADPAFILDLTPIDAITPDMRAVEWRRPLLEPGTQSRRRPAVVQAPIG